MADDAPPVPLAAFAAAAAAAAAALTLRSALPLRTGKPPLPRLLLPRFGGSPTPSAPAPPAPAPPSSLASSQASSFRPFRPGRSCVHRLLWFGGWMSSLSLSRARSAGEGGRKIPPLPRAFVHFLSGTCRSGRHFSQKYSAASTKSGGNRDQLEMNRGHVRAKLQGRAYRPASLPR